MRIQPEVTGSQQSTEEQDEQFLALTRHASMIW